MSPGVKTLPTSLFTAKVKPASPAKFHEWGVFHAVCNEMLEGFEFGEACKNFSATTWLLRTASLSLKRCLSACLASVCKVVVAGSSHVCHPLTGSFPGLFHVLFPRLVYLQASILELVGNPLTDGVGDTIPTRVPCVLARCVFTSIFVPCPVKADVDAIEGLHITTIFSLWLVLSLPRILLVNTLACTWCWSWWWEDCRHSLCSINLIEQRRFLKFFSQKPMCVAEILMTLFHGCLGLKLDSSGWAAKNASCLRSSWIQNSDLHRMSACAARCHTLGCSCTLALKEAE